MYGKQGSYGQPQQGYGAPQQGKPVGQPGYPPQQGYGAPPGYGATQGGQPGYGAPQGGQPGYGAPQGGQPGYGAPQGAQPGYGAPQGKPGAPGYGAQPPHGTQPGYGAPQGGQQPGYGAPQAHGQPGYGAPHGQPPQGGQPGYGAPQGGHGQYMANSYQPNPQQMQSMGGQYYGQLQPHEIAEMKGWFAAVDRDHSGTVTATELSTMTFAGKKFSLTTSKMLINVFDTDRNGTIGFFEYCALHKFITSMQAAFYAHDKDRSGKLDIREAHQAVYQGGFQFSEPTIKQVYSRFEKKGYGTKSGGLDFETFLQLCAYLGQVRSTFALHDTDRDGWVRLNLETLVQMSVSMPTLKV